MSRTSAAHRDVVVRGDGRSSSISSGLAIFNTLSSNRSLSGVARSSSTSTFFVGLIDLIDLNLILFESAASPLQCRGERALIATSSFAATVAHELFLTRGFSLSRSALAPSTRLLCALEADPLRSRWPRDLLILCRRTGLSGVARLRLLACRPEQSVYLRIHRLRIGAPLLQVSRRARSSRRRSFAAKVYLVSHVLVYQYFFVGLNNLVDLELIVFESALRPCNVAASALIATSSFAATFLVGLNNLVDLELIVFESALRSCNVAASALIATSSFAATVAHELFLTRGFSLSLRSGAFNSSSLRIGGSSSSISLASRSSNTCRRTGLSGVARPRLPVYLVSHVLVYQYFFVGLNNLVDLELIVFRIGAPPCNVAASALIATSSFAATILFDLAGSRSSNTLSSNRSIWCRTSSSTSYVFVGLIDLIDLELILFESALRPCKCRGERAHRDVVVRGDGSSSSISLASRSSNTLSSNRSNLVSHVPRLVLLFVGLNNLVDLELIVFESALRPCNVAASALIATSSFAATADPLRSRWPRDLLTLRHRSSQLVSHVFVYLLVGLIDLIDLELILFESGALPLAISRRARHRDVVVRGDGGSRALLDARFSLSLPLWAPSTRLLCALEADPLRSRWPRDLLILCRRTARLIATSSFAATVAHELFLTRGLLALAPLWRLQTRLLRALEADPLRSRWPRDLLILCRRTGLSGVARPRLPVLLRRPEQSRRLELIVFESALRSCNVAASALIATSSFAAKILFDLAGSRSSNTLSSNRSIWLSHVFVYLSFVGLNNLVDLELIRLRIGAPPCNVAASALIATSSFAATADPLRLAGLRDSKLCVIDQVQLVSHVFVYLLVGLIDLIDLELILFESALLLLQFSASALIATSSFAATVYLVSHVLVYQYFFVGLNNLVDLELIRLRIGRSALAMSRRARSSRRRRFAATSSSISLASRSSNTLSIEQGLSGVARPRLPVYFFVGLNNLSTLNCIVFESALRPCNVAASALIATSSFAATYFFVGLNNLVDLELIVFESALRSCNVAASALIATSSFAATVASTSLLDARLLVFAPLWRLQLADPLRRRYPRDLLTLRHRSSPAGVARLRLLACRLIDLIDLELILFESALCFLQFRARRAHRERRRSRRRQLLFDLAGSRDLLILCRRTGLSGVARPRLPVLRSSARTISFDLELIVFESALRLLQCRGRARSSRRRRSRRPVAHELFFDARLLASRLPLWRLQLVFFCALEADPLRSRWPRDLLILCRRTGSIWCRTFLVYQYFFSSGLNNLVDLELIVFDIGAPPLQCRGRRARSSRRRRFAATVAHRALLDARLSRSRSRSLAPFNSSSLRIEVSSSSISLALAIFSNTLSSNRSIWCRTSSSTSTSSSA
uniref:G_PROTEIN_RECEP_F1_2 domain-containing protein n=1 Tax=Macrostomum lignano TaxID=282301 RepID=A0A1I8JRM7_9PLAT